MRLGPYHFKDSCWFLNSSLDSLVKMSKDARGEKFDLILNSHLCKGEEDVSCEKYYLLTAKAILTYEHLNDMASSEEGFPSHSKFYISLRGGNI